MANKKKTMSEAQWDRKVRGEKYPGYDNSFLKDKPKGLSDNEVLYRGATDRWKKGKYRKQAEEKEAKEHKQYDKDKRDNGPVKRGDGPTEGSKEEYVRRNQVEAKLAARKRVGGSAKAAGTKTKTASKKTTRKRVAGK